ncbi:MAG: error-prone DNA polymerase [Dehalococcoidia bacterium]
MYAELHCHSAYSFREGASTVEELVLTARELGYAALALTDHDNLAGAMVFAQTAKAWGVQPIIGAEVTVRGVVSGEEMRGHLTLLAETQRGYANLSRLISHAHLSSPRDEPVLDIDVLEGCTEGIIALSGCREGFLSQLVTGGRPGEACALAGRLADAFGRSSFFIELQRNLVYGDCARNRGLVELARGLGLGIAATNNVHYHERARHRLQDVLVAIRHRTTLDASERLRRKNAEFYLKPPREMERTFVDLPEAIANTTRIAGRCTFDLTRDLTYRFPDYETPDGRTADEYLEEVCRLSAREYYGVAAPSIEPRLKEELKLVRQAQQAGFFLRNWEIMQYAKRNGLPSRGRGSSVGSLVCYLLGLSGIDPIKYNLFHGRFLNEARQGRDMPDIDIDFTREAREAMFAHVLDTYGTERAAMVANVIEYRYPMAIREAGKALGLPETDIDKLAKRMRGRFARTLQEEMRAIPEFAGRMEAPIWREFARLVEELRGMPRHLGQHSGGMIISSTPLVEQVPVQPSAMPGRFIAQWDKDSVADSGMIKMDFLSYPSLGHLYRALKLVEERRGIIIDPVRIPLDDPEVYAMIRGGDVIGIVQIQSRAQLQAIMRLDITSIEDLVVQVALIRPGPIQGGAVHPYIARRQGREPVVYDHPDLEPILRETMGVIVFQEQAIGAAMVVAGMTAGQAETLRRAMSRKRSREEMEKLRDAFMEDAEGRGVVTRAVAETVFAKILAFSSFGFPRAHAAAMAETAAKLAWVKRYYPVEFYVAWLNEWPFGFYSPGVVTNEARRNGVEIHGVDVNKSRGECVIEGDAIRLGYNYVRGVGEATRQRLDEEAAGGPYASLWDFWQRTRIEREPIERLIRLGAFGWTGLHERELLWQLGLFYRPLGRQLPLHLTHEADLVPLREMTPHERILADLACTEGALITRGHIMDLAVGSLHEGITPSYLLDKLEAGAPVTVAGFVAVRQAPETAKGFVFHTLEDHHGLMNIITNPRLVARYRRVIEEASVLIVRGHIEREDRAVNVVTEHMERVAPAGDRLARRGSHDW